MKWLIKLLFLFDIFYEVEKYETYIAFNYTTLEQLNA